jgi:hypothetical protein
MIKHIEESQKNIDFEVLVFATVFYRSCTGSGRSQTLGSGLNTFGCKTLISLAQNIT